MKNSLKKTILLVEDEVITATFEKKQLEQKGYSVIHVYSGEEAVKKFNEQITFDLILMDIDLGDGIDGTEAAELILAHHDIPIVFLSSHIEPEIVEKTEKITSYGYVVKNTGITVLDASIKMAFKLFESKKREREIKEAEQVKNELLNRMFTASPLAIVVTDNDAKVTMWSPATEHMFGWSESEALGKPLPFIPEKDKTKFEQSFSGLKDGKSDILREAVRMKKDGTLINVSISTSPLFNANGAFIGGLAVISNITEQKKAEQSLISSEERFRQLFENMKNGVAIYEAYNDGEDFIFKDYNSTAEEMDNTKKVFVLHKKVTDVFPGVKKFGIFDVFQRVYKTGKPETHPISLYEDDRISAWRENYVFKLPSGEIVAIYQDITEKKLLEHELQLTKDMLMAAIDNSQAGIAIADAPDGTLRYVNKAGLMIRGGEYDEIVKDININDYVASWQILDLDGTPLPTNQVPLARAIMYGEKNTGEFIVRRSNRDDRYVIANAAPIFNKNGKVASAIVIFLDITDHKNIEMKINKLSNLKEKLLQQAPLSKKLSYITESIVNIFTAEFARIWILKDGDKCDEDCYYANENHDDHKCTYKNKCLHLVASSGCYTHMDGEMHSRIPLGCFMVGRIVSGEEPSFFSNDVANDPRIHDREWAKKTSLVSSAHLQLVSQSGDPIGAIALFSKHVLSQYEIPIIHNIAASTSQIIMTSKAINAQAESEKMFRAMFNHANDGILLAETETKQFIMANKKICEMLQYSEKELLTLSVKDIHPPESLSKVADAFEKQLSKEVRLVERLPVKRKDGTIFYADINSTPIMINETTYLLGIFRDITKHIDVELEIKKTLEKNQELLRELHHRTKNNFFMISNMVNLMTTNTESQETKSILEEISSRINAVSELYTLLFKSESYTEVNLKKYIQKIIAALPTDENSFTILFSGNDIVTSIDLAIPVGLIVNELLTNAVKYAFPDGYTGKIEVSLTMDNNIIQIIISDNGIGLPDNFTISKINSMGIHLVKSLILQIDGHFSIESKTGTHCIISFPL